MAATADQHRLRIVIDPDDDLDTLRAARALHARPFGQIVCEVDPTTSTDTLAHHLLDALGKTTGPTSNAWRRAGALLAAERIDHLVLLRAHLLSYPALRRLADCTAATDTRLWLLAAGELPTHAIGQLLERRPHHRSALAAMLAELALEDLPGQGDLPPSHGPEFPWITRPSRPVRSRPDVTRGLRGSDRTCVLSAYNDAHAWVTAWDDEHPAGTQQQAADAAYALCAAAETASEITVRAHAALHALAGGGWTTRSEALDDLAHHRWWEHRPSEYAATVARAAQIADTCADPFDACLIALSALTRCPHTLRNLRVTDLAADAAVMVLAGHILAVPPKLRPALVAQRLTAKSTGQEAPLLPGPSHGRPNTTTMRRSYDHHAVPDSLRARGARHDDHDGDWAADLSLDGRDVIRRLSAFRLFQR